MKICAGAPCSICLARAALDAEEILAFFPVSFCHCALIASRAFLRLAAAKIRTSPPCACAGVCGEPQTPQSTT